MADRMSLESIAKLVLKLIAFILILLVVYLILRATKPSLFGIDKTTSGKNLVQADLNVPVYSEFIKNYKECKLSPSVECFCPITNVDTGQNYVIELENEPGVGTNIKLYSNAQLSNCGEENGNTLSPTNKMEDIKSVTTKISGDILYFKNVWGDPDVEGVSYETVEEYDPDKVGSVTVTEKKITSYGTLNRNDFILVAERGKDTGSLFLYNNQLCSSIDVWGNNYIDLSSSAYIYKFDRERTAITHVVGGLKKCDYVKDSVPAEEELNKIFSVITQCNSASCFYPINIPQDFTIKLETTNTGFRILKELNLYYKETKISTKEFTKELCQYTHFSQDKNTETQLSSLTLNGYKQIEIYPFADKICILPYDEALTLERQIVLASSQNQPIVPQ